MERREENQVQQRERIQTIQSHCRASPHHLTALVPAAPWWFHCSGSGGTQVCFIFFLFSFFLSYVLLFKSSKNFYFFQSPCANFYSRNSCFGFIFGFGLYEILGFLLSPCAFQQLLHLSMPQSCLIKCLKEIWLLLMGFGCLV